MRLEIDQRARRVLALIPRRRVYSVIELGLLALLAVQGARLAWMIVTPIGPLGDWRAPLPGGGTSGAAMLRSFDPFFRLEPTQAQGQAAAVTSLPLVLFGTRTDGATGRGSAIIGAPDGEQKSYVVGEEIAPGVTLKAVAFDHVTLSRGGADEDLFIDQSGGGATPLADGTAPETSGVLGGPASGAAARGTPVTLARLRAEIGFIPRIEGGRVTGLVVRPQGAGAAFRQIGLVEGDIVTQIGGRPVSGQADLDQLASQFAKGGNLSLTVERGAEQLPIVVTVAPQ